MIIMYWLVYVCGSLQCLYVCLQYVGELYVVQGVCVRVCVSSVHWWSVGV